MRAITKQGNGGYHLNQSHANPPATAAQAATRWSRFSHKQAVLSSLLAEQYGLCCYSELRADEEGLGCHIEHVENKSRNPPRTFDYANLAASALHSDDLKTLNTVAAFGGHAIGKRAGCDMARFVSCHQLDCRRFFAYVSDGRIVPSHRLNQVEADSAQYTIDLLNLNSPYLRTLRRKWWDELEDVFQEHQSRQWSLDDLASIDLIPTNNLLRRFFSLTRQFYGIVAERVLQAQAPQLR
ncbi:MAG TPA: retron system putative HNH endonuclease [Dokdonella sp.]|uniref:retron system putative HNH endonuclease n=1 Tax=Dokdonella sp. TaxID=2291710 RepID=UPI002B528013|nr:retron system putative HNH endonuclease [Dokdonella sp.]HUD41380.1 retron system putative HNH endonuclease [Dokdonella sp.]